LLFNDPIGLKPCLLRIIFSELKLAAIDGPGTRRFIIERGLNRIKGLPDGQEMICEFVCVIRVSFGVLSLTPALSEGEGVGWCFELIFILKQCDRLTARKNSEHFLRDPRVLRAFAFQESSLKENF
jgi:hypothetical protein